MTKKPVNSQIIPPPAVVDPDKAKLAVAMRYSWYIINGIMFKIKKLEDAITEAKAAEAAKPANTDTMIYNSLSGLIEHCEQQIKEYKEALDALKAAGFR